MSGYDSATGWTHWIPSKWRRYWRPIEGAPQLIEDGLEAADLPYYWDASGGLHVRCDEASLWELLSGEPATRGHDASPGTATEWLSVTDIGANFDPPLATSAVLARLRSAGILERVDGQDRPSAAAHGLFEERAASATKRFPSKPGSVQRRWAFAVLERLRRSS